MCLVVEAFYLIDILCTTSCFQYTCVMLAVCGGIGEEKGGRRSLHLLPLLYCCSRLSRTEPEGGHPSTHPALQVNLLSAVFSSRSTFASTRQPFFLFSTSRTNNYESVMFYVNGIYGFCKKP